MVQNPFSNSLESHFGIEPKEGTTLIRFLIHVAKSYPIWCKTTPLPTTVSSGVLYFLQMYLLIYPDSSPTKNLIRIGLNLLTVMLSPDSPSEMMLLWRLIINNPIKLPSMCWSALKIITKCSVLTKEIFHFREQHHSQFTVGCLLTSSIVLTLS